MSDLKFDFNNFRIHTDKNKRIIRKSLAECGAGRSILIDNDSVLIAGKLRYFMKDGESIVWGNSKKEVLSFPFSLMFRISQSFSGAF